MKKDVFEKRFPTALSAHGDGHAVLLGRTHGRNGLGTRRQDAPGSLRRSLLDPRLGYG